MMVAAEFIENWGAALWRASWQGGLVVLGVWCICRMAPSLPARFQAWLWRLALLKFLVVLVWPATIELPLLPAAAPAEVFPAQAISESSFTPSILDMESAPVRNVSLRLIPAVIWSAVALWQIARLVTAFRAAHWLRRSGRVSTSESLHAQLANLSKWAGLRTPPALLDMEGDGSPLLLGILRPAIVFPAATLSRLNETERALVLAHELAHVGRGDLLWSVVAASVRAVFWFHPLAWLGQKQLSLTQEIAADELAIATHKQNPVSYAELLVSVVTKLGSCPLRPALSVGVAGSHLSLQQRLIAMRYMKPASRAMLAACGCSLVAIAGLGLVPWMLVAAEPPTADKLLAAEKTPDKVPAASKSPDKVADKVPDKTPDKPTPKEQIERGRFVSFQDGTLTLSANSGATISNKIPANAKILVWNNEANAFRSAAASETLDRVELGTWFVVRKSDENVTLQIGSRKGQTVGTFVSYKDDRLLLLGKNLGESFTKKYGNNVHFNKFRDDVPAYESIDGGEYKLIGTANKVLGNVKEGTLVTVHGAGDDNITLVQIGVPAKK